MNTRNQLYCVEGIIAALKKIEDLEEFLQSLVSKLKKFVSRENPHLITLVSLEDSLSEFFESSELPQILKQVDLNYAGLDTTPCRACSSNVRCVFCPSQD